MYWKIRTSLICTSVTVEFRCSHAPASRLGSADSFNIVLVVIPSVVVRLEVRGSAFSAAFLLA